MCATSLLNEIIIHRYPYVTGMDPDRDDRLTSDHILLDIYYESMQTVEISQFQSQTIESLSGTIGGLLGLWVSFARLLF